MNYSTQKCSIKKSLSGTSYLLRKFRAYILIKRFNVYLKTLNRHNTLPFHEPRRKSNALYFILYREIHRSTTDQKEKFSRLFSC